MIDRQQFTALSASCPAAWRSANNEPARSEGGDMAKRFGRPSAQYRYEHYDPE
jgi:hypothetical protein